MEEFNDPSTFYVCKLPRNIVYSSCHGFFNELRASFLFSPRYLGSSSRIKTSVLQKLNSIISELEIMRFYFARLRSSTFDIISESFSFRERSDPNDVLKKTFRQNENSELPLRATIRSDTRDTAITTVRSRCGTSAWTRDELGNSAFLARKRASPPSLRRFSSASRVTRARVDI